MSACPLHPARLVAGRFWRFAVVAVCLGLLLPGAWPLLAQESPPGTPPPEAEAQGQPPAEDVPATEEGAEAGDAATADPTNFDAIDDLLAQDEEVLSGPGGFTYDPGVRRDPFKSLIRSRESVESAEVERPDGPAGLLIDEIEIDGIFVLEDGPVAQVQSASQETSFLLRPGDQLWDGDVVRITLDEVVFKQTVNDPTALKPFREVVKKLSP